MFPQGDQGTFKYISASLSPYIFKNVTHLGEKNDLSGMITKHHFTTPLENLGGQGFPNNSHSDCLGPELFINVGNLDGKNYLSGMIKENPNLNTTCDTRSHGCLCGQSTPNDSPRDCLDQELSKWSE